MRRYLNSVFGNIGLFIYLAEHLSDLILSYQEKHTMNNRNLCMLAEKSTTLFCGTTEVDKYAKDFFKDYSLWQTLTQEMALPPEALASGGIPYEVDLSPEERQDLQTLFYEGFINSSYPDPSIRDKEIYAYIRHYEIVIDRILPLFGPASLAQVEINVAKLHFFLFQPRLLVFAIEINNDGRFLQDITLQNRTIRGLERYAHSCLSKEFLELYRPLLYLHNRVFPATIPEGDYSPEALSQYIKLLYRGNKLKFYLTVKLERTCDDLFHDDAIDELLYELGTCSPLGMMSNPADKAYPSKAYYRKLIDRNVVSCFANWRALALMDTFCVVMKWDTPDYSYRMWQKGYFRFVYINALFIKSFLVYINDKYKRSDASDELENEFMAFDKIFNFHAISYNFLPQIVYAKIRHGLEIDAELQVLNEKIRFFSEKLERVNEKKINHLLIWLAVIAIFSAVNDAMELLQKIEVATPQDDYYPWIGRGILTFVIGVAVCLFLFKSQKKIG